MISQSLARQRVQTARFAISDRGRSDAPYFGYRTSRVEVCPHALHRHVCIHRDTPASWSL